MVMRPVKENEGIIESLQKLAEKKKYSLNKYLNIILANHVKKATK